MRYDFGIRLRQLREKLGLSQQQVAARLRISRTTISNYENNVKMPTLETVCRLASFYSTSVDYILGRDKAEVVTVDTSSLTEKQRRLLLDVIGRLMTEFEGG